MGSNSMVDQARWRMIMVIGGEGRSGDRCSIWVEKIGAWRLSRSSQIGDRRQLLAMAFPWDRQDGRREEKMMVLLS